MGKDKYDINKLLRDAINGRWKMLHTDHRDWAMCCCALKLLNRSEDDFVALSSGDEYKIRARWRAEKNPRRYNDEDGAKGKIINLAKEYAKSAGIDMKQYLLSQDYNHHPRRRTYPRRPPPTKTAAAPPMPTQPPQVPDDAVYISEQQLEDSAARCRETSLYTWLCGLFPAADVDRVFALYKIGASKFLNNQGGRAVCYPLINVEGKCVDMKIMHVNPLTGSRKDAPPLYVKSNGEPSTTTFALFLLHMSDRRAPWCNFGDHLLNDRPDAEINIVESEKTALILSLRFPSLLWVAVGSISNLNATKLYPYRNRKIVLYPDRDGINAWRNKADALAAAGYSVSVQRSIECFPGQPKDDLADIVVRLIKGTQAPPTEPMKTAPQPTAAERAWSDFKVRYPELITIESLLDLEPIRVTNFPTNFVEKPANAV